MKLHELMMTHRDLARKIYKLVPSFSQRCSFDGGLYYKGLVHAFSVGFIDRIILGLGRQSVRKDQCRDLGDGVGLGPGVLLGEDRDLGDRSIVPAFFISYPFRRHFFLWFDQE
jgi:hypothetical protein